MAVSTVNAPSTTQRGLVKTASVSFSGASSVSIDGCFSSLYTHYIVRRNFVGSVGDQGVRVRLRAAGTDATGAGYRIQQLFLGSTSFSAARYTGLTELGSMLGYTETTAYGMDDLWITNPFEATQTKGWHECSYDHDGSIAMQITLWEHDNATSYDGVSVYPASGSITGTVSVYGFVES